VTIDVKIADGNPAWYKAASAPGADGNDEER